MSTLHAEPLERAVVGALRAAIKDHGAITPAHVGSAAKRVLGNLRNVGAGPDLEPGAHRDILLPAIICRCARCSHAWLVQRLTDRIGAEPELPERCPGCFARTWAQAVARVSGRPMGAKDSRPMKRE